MFLVDDLRIDTDGKASDEMKQRNYYGDLDHAADNETSYFQDRIAADEIPYFVIPYKTKKQKEKFENFKRYSCISSLIVFFFPDEWYIWNYCHCAEISYLILQQQTY